jgi:hypothetical protein
MTITQTCTTPAKLGDKITNMKTGQSGVITAVKFIRSEKKRHGGSGKGPYLHYTQELTISF